MNTSIINNHLTSASLSTTQSIYTKERLTWTEVDLKKFRRNYLAITEYIQPETNVMGVVKANAYGHGIVRIAKELQKLGANYLAVACIYEGKQLREAGIKLPIFLLGYTDVASVPLALEYNLTISIKDELVLQEISKQAGLRNMIANVHVNVDTGMHFYGATPDKAIPLILRTQEYKNIFLEGIFSHFADAEADDLTYSYQQVATFNYVLDEVKKFGITPPLIHMANGAAIVRIPESHFTMVRPGTFLYGQQTGEQIPGHIPEQVLSFKTVITHIRELGEGESVGYGQSFVTNKRSVIASIPVGYADGFHRNMGYLGSVLVRGRKAPVIIKPAMDQTAIDITGIPDVKVGDEVVLFGRQGRSTITLNEIAEHMHTANYAIISGITERVSRKYKT